MKAPNPFPTAEEAHASKGGILPLDTVVVKELSRGGAPAQYWLLARSAVVNGNDLRDARPQQSSQNGGWETEFVLTQDAAKRFEKFTAANIGNRLAIVLDGSVLSAPVIHGKISDNGVIEGLSGHDEAADLALNLRSGSLPAGVGFWRSARWDLRSGRIRSRKAPFQRPGGRFRGRGGHAGLLQAQRHQCDARVGSECDHSDRGA